MTPIERYVAALHEGESKREEVRERLLGDDLNEAERSRLSTEIVRWNGELERTARALNDELRQWAERGQAPRTPLRLDDLRDPDLRAFGAQVKATCERLQRLEAEKDARAAGERAQLEKERLRAREIERESEKRRREIDEEKKKVEKARKDLDRDRKRLKDEREKFEREEAHFEDEKKRVKEEREDLDQKIEDQKAEARRIDQDQTRLAAQLKVADAASRTALTQRQQQLDARARDLDRVIARNVQLRDEQLRSIERSMKKEDEQLDEARRRFEKEQHRLAQESKRLEDEDERLDKAAEQEKERLAKLRQIDAKLAKELA
ncbi:MAG TPA: hypothetical protein VFF73_26595 [Planctomycetota bacterium]|nr:hypothetical protein [Planctomycetota bacterium]